MVAVEKKVEYENWVEEEGDDDGRKGGEEEARKGGWACRVKVGDEVVCCVRRGRNRIEAETRGAEEAVRILRGRRNSSEDSSGDGDVYMEDLSSEYETADEEGPVL